MLPLFKLVIQRNSNHINNTLCKFLPVVYICIYRQYCVCSIFNLLVVFSITSLRFLRIIEQFRKVCWNSFENCEASLFLSNAQHSHAQPFFDSFFKLVTAHKKAVETFLRKSFMHRTFSLFLRHP